MADDISEKQNEAAAIIDAPMNEGDPGFSSENAWDIHKTVHHQEQPKLRYDEPLAERKRAIDEREKAAKHRREIIRRNPAPQSGVSSNETPSPVEENAQGTVNMLDILLEDVEDDKPITLATADAAAQGFHEKQQSFRNPYEQKQAPASTKTESTGGYKAPGVIASEQQRAAINKARQQRNANYRPGTMPRKAD